VSVIGSTIITSRGSTNFVATLIIRVVIRIAPFSLCGRCADNGCQG
jgi:hypothetical protein